MTLPARSEKRRVQPGSAALNQIRTGNPDIISADLSALDGRELRNGK